MFESLANTSVKLFGSIIKPYIGYFDPLKDGLSKAEIKLSIEEYLSTLLLLSLTGFVVSLISGSLLITLFLPFAAYSYTLSIIISFCIAGGIFTLGYIYPSIVYKGIQKEIDKSLPFATFYMATTASSGVNPVELFKVLSLRKGRIGMEAKKIYNNVKTLGINLPTALQRSAVKSPSDDFSDLLWGMMSVITAGGDLEEYLKNKTETLMSKYRRSLNDYAKMITLYTEIYITLVIVGSLFFIILISIISPMTGMSTLFVQTFLVFFFVPLISIGFIVLLKSISPTE